MTPEEERDVAEVLEWCKKLGADEDAKFVAIAMRKKMTMKK